MEEKIIRKCTLWIVGISMTICALMLYLPEFTQAANNWVKEYRTMQVEARHREEMTALELLRYHETKIEIEEQEQIGNSLRFYCGEDLTITDIEIKNDYMARDVELFFPGLTEAILDKYPIVGSTNHIEDMNVWSDEKGLYVEIITNIVVEPVLEGHEEYCLLTLENPWDVFDKIVVVDAGHGGRMPGTVKDSAKEKDINLSIVKKLKEYLDTEEDIKVYYTRLKDKDISLQDRVNLANEVQADLFISVHQNALGGSYNSTKGTQVLYSESGKNSKGSKQLASILLKHVTTKAQSVNKGVISGNRIYIVRTAKMPVALAEIGFVTNKQEQKKLLSKNYQDTVAQALYEGILEALDSGL